jgi:hypothetical protein
MGPGVRRDDDRKCCTFALVVIKHTFTSSRRVASELCQNPSPREKGVGNAGCMAHPQPRVRMGRKKMHTSIHSEVAKIIRHPHAMVYGL